VGDDVRRSIFRLGLAADQIGIQRRRHGYHGLTDAGRQPMSKQVSHSQRLQGYSQMRPQNLLRTYPTE
jgi:hypothetical protein